MTQPHARVIAMDGKVTTQETLLIQDSYTIGRSTNCNIVVQSNLISRTHASITYQQMRYILQDEGSANGTFVNNRRISEPHPLKDQDLIGLGSPAPLLRFLDPDPTFVPATRLQYDDHTLQFSIDNEPLHLPPNQFRLLLHLYQHASDLCSREDCAQAMWHRPYNEDTDGDALDRTVYSLRRNLRKFIDDDLITTRRGVGYVLEM